MVVFDATPSNSAAFTSVRRRKIIDPDFTRVTHRPAGRGCRRRAASYPAGPLCLAQSLVPVKEAKIHGNVLRNPLAYVNAQAELLE